MLVQVGNALTDFGVRAAVVAQSVPNPAPIGNAPGMNVINRLIGWAKMLAIGVCVLSIVVGGGAYAISRYSSNVHGQVRASSVMSGAMGAAFMIGAASFFITVALQLAQAVSR